MANVDGGHVGDMGVTRQGPSQVAPAWWAWKWAAFLPFLNAHILFCLFWGDLGWEEEEEEEEEEEAVVVVEEESQSDSEQISEPAITMELTREEVSARFSLLFHILCNGLLLLLFKASPSIHPSILSDAFISLPSPPLMIVLSFR